MLKHIFKTLISVTIYLCATVIIFYVGLRFNYFNINYDIFTSAKSPEVVEQFTLGKYNTRPFYQTKKDYQFIKSFDKHNENLKLEVLLNYYNQYYRQYFRSGRLDVEAIRITENQYPIIYQYVKYSCFSLDVKMPRIYLTKDDGPNIKAAFWKNPILLISANLTWAFKPEELNYLIAREIGHIKTKHIYYRDLLQVFKQVNESGISGKLMSWIKTGVGLELIEWFKESEITADRAGLTVTGDINVAINALVKLKLGANVDTYYGEINPDEYIKQLSTVTDKSKKGFGPLFAELRSNSPFLSLRIKNLIDFYQKNQSAFK